MTSPYLMRVLRSRDQVPPKPAPKDPWPYEAGAEPPKFLTEKKDER
jgi:hypothetical protein